MTMKKHTTSSGSAGIPQQIIFQFLEQLEAENFPSELIARLKDTLLEKGDLSESAIRKALSPEDR
jgi:hypothetical protein